MGKTNPRSVTRHRRKKHIRNRSTVLPTVPG